MRALGAPTIYYANHTSHADVLLLLAALPPDVRGSVRPVAASDYWNRDPVRRFLAQEVFRCIAVSRLEVNRNANPLDAMQRALLAGQSLILFPEGTRGDGTRLLPFRSGIHRLLQATPAAQAVPVWIQNAHRALPRGSWLPAPVPCTVTFGAPLHLSTGTPKAGVLAAASLALEEVARECIPKCQC
ncbi:MAG: 1-acyl-sn-glycerol-3-phosphate acyltransferase [Bryobacterales bacterium]|nr:1-acyl-sn-glycerol-3-phosphate acyltransferase [Bryobacterales bacterium]